MADKVKILGIGGSMAAQSHSLAALNIALEGAADAGADVELCDIRIMNLPMYAPHLQADAPYPVREFVEKVCEAQGMIWSSPLYHGTISGSFKNALDWLELLKTNTPPYLTDKIIGLISTAGGVQGLQAINTMEFMVRSLRGWAVPLVMPVARAWQMFDEQGLSRDPTLTEQLHLLGREVHRATAQFAAEGSCDYSA